MTDQSTAVLLAAPIVVSMLAATALRARFHRRTDRAATIGRLVADYARGSAAVHALLVLQPISITQRLALPVLLVLARLVLAPRERLVDRLD